MKYIAIFLLFFVIGCKKKEGLELEIVNKEINSLNFNVEDFKKFIKTDTLISYKLAKTILEYKLINNSDKTYYFNLDGFNDNLEKNYIKIDRSFINIFDNNKQKVKIYSSEPTVSGFGNFKDYNYLSMKELNYTFLTKNKNFIIHPKETIYFEWFIILPYGSLKEFENYSVILDSQKKYFAEILMYSDGVNYKKNISRTDLKTIEENGYKVYNGIIKSKNKIPVKFVNP